MSTPKPNDGGPAFPTPFDYDTVGMTLRAYFAGRAMQGILQAVTNAHLHHSTQTPPDDIIAKWAVGAADALIEELNK